MMIVKISSADLFIVISSSFWLLDQRIVAAFVEWIAPQNSAYRFPAAFDGAIFVYRLVSVMRTAGIESAGIGWKGAGDGLLVNSYENKQHKLREIDDVDSKFPY